MTERTPKIHSAFVVDHLDFFSHLNSVIRDCHSVLSILHFTNAPQRMIIENVFIDTLNFVGVEIIDAGVEK